jgi:hypothetical protein
MEVKIIFILVPSQLELWKFIPSKFFLITKSGFITC